MVTTSSPDAWHGVTMEAERNVPLRKATPVTDVQPAPVTGEVPGQGVPTDAGTIEDSVVGR
jgi:hypothetical protein